MGKCLVTKLKGIASNERLPRLGYLSFNAKKVSGKEPIFIVGGTMEIIADKPIIIQNETVTKKEIAGQNIAIKLTMDDTFICIKTNSLTIDCYQTSGTVKTDSVNGLYNVAFVGCNLGNINTLDLPASCVTESLVTINSNFNINIDDFKVCSNLTTLIVSGNMTGTSSDSIKAIPSASLRTFVVRGECKFPIKWSDFSKFTKLFELQVNNVTGEHKDLLDALHAAGKTSGEIYLNGSHYTFSSEGWS